MPAYDICYLDDSGALTYKFSANCDNDQRARVLAHAMKPAGTKRPADIKRLEVWNEAALIYARPSAGGSPHRIRPMCLSARNW